MSAPLVIADLDETLEQKLLDQAALHGRTREDEAREILSQVLSGEEDHPAIPSVTPERMRSAIESVRGIWKGRMTTDEIMELTRGDDSDDAYSRR